MGRCTAPQHAAISATATQDLITAACESSESSESPSPPSTDRPTDNYKLSGSPPQHHYRNKRTDHGRWTEDGGREGGTALTVPDRRWDIASPATEMLRPRPNNHCLRSGRTSTAHVTAQAGRPRFDGPLLPIGHREKDIHSTHYISNGLGGSAPPRDRLRPSASGSRKLSCRCQRK